VLSPSYDPGVSFVDMGEAFWKLFVCLDIWMGAILFLVKRLDAYDAIMYL